jgi:hypothetical protein
MASHGRVRDRGVLGFATIAGTPKAWYERGMEELFGNPAYKGFVLQDKKRLPARFFARISGALTSRPV